MLPTVCRLCGEPFAPKGEEHVCAKCAAELDELERQQPQPIEENSEDQCQSP